ncbi:hypothetical protein K8S19_04985 [bacterium]|nr:hypothetical protein [bacterium]
MLNANPVRKKENKRMIPIAFIITLLTILSFNSLVLADQQQDEALKKMLRSQLGHLGKIMKLKKEYPVPEEKYEIVKSMKMTSGHLNGVLHTRQRDIKIGYDIQLKNMVYKKTVNQKEIDKAQSELEAATRKIYAGTNMGNQIKSMEEDTKNKLKKCKSPEYRRVVSGDAIMTLRVNQASKRMGVLKNLPAVIIACPFKATMNDACLLLGSREVAMQMMSELFQNDQTNAGIKPDVVINFIFDFDRKVNYIYQERIAGPVYGGKGGGDFSSGPLNDPRQSVLDFEQFFYTLSAFGIFTNKNKQLSISVREKIPYFKMMERGPFKRLGADKGTGAISAESKWPRPRGKKAQPARTKPEEMDYPAKKEKKREKPKKSEEDGKDDFDDIEKTLAETIEEILGKYNIDISATDILTGIAKTIIDPRNLKTVTEPVNEIVLAIMDEIILKDARNAHYNRNENNDVPEYEGDIPEDWIEFPGELKIYHTQGISNANNLKYSSLDGEMEGVYKDGKLVADSLNMGTYNFGSPKDNWFGHLVLDLVPYYLWGNSPDDPSTMKDRLLLPLRAK